ncbi:MAG: hypothetical protein H7123_05800 [Thermoleophilia bacterium]|nr:hypothetical protein [Thermoleophilia bacterium]
MAVATVGVVLGGSYWVHYLLQLAFPAAIAAGFIAHRARLKLVAMQGIVLLVLTLVVSLVAINAGAAAVLLAKPYHVNDAEIGDWIGDHSRPGDTIWVEYARANIVHASRLETPYPYMWSLMVRARPGAIDQLHTLLDSNQRPTWVVRWNIDNGWQLDPYGSTGAALARNYTKVGTVCGVEIMHDTATLPTSDMNPSKSMYHGCAHHEWSDVLFGVVD